jgi:polyketide cyclase/dehydrase/lipid transport protein
VARPFEFDRVFDFPVPPEEFWATVEATDRFPEWWGWLREFRSDGLQAGSVAECVIRAPLPYTLRLTVTIEEARAPELIATRISGDLEGPARLEVAPTPSGCSARLTWSLDLRDRLLRRFALVGRPLMVWAHDRVISVGMESFEQVALVGHAEP